MVLTSEQGKDEDEDTEEEDDDKDENYEYTPRLKKKPDFISLQVPRKISATSSLTGVRCLASASTQSMIQANIINASGGNLEDFVISKTSAWRNNRKVVSKKVDEMKQKIVYFCFYPSD